MDTIKTMKAVRLHQYGGPEVLVYEDAPKPVPNEDDVLIRVHAAGVNPVDWKKREGYLHEVAPLPFPQILGGDASGVIEVVGDNIGDSNLKVGDAVYALCEVGRNGAYAEYVAVKASAVARKPANISHVEAASLPIVALTAWQALFEEADLQAGQRILIHAAAGGVGSVAVQMARWKGAYVIGTASTANHDFVQGLGADEVIDYTMTPFEEVVRGVDVVFDTVGRETQARSWQTLRPGGFLVGIVSEPSAEEAQKHQVRSSYLFSRPDGRDLAAIAALVETGSLRPLVETVLPLQEAKKAQEMSESHRTRGKIVLEVVPAA